MTFSNCPRCDELFRMPMGQMPPEAYARCPWCRETFPLSDVLEKLPPMLEILPADGHAVVGTPQPATDPEDTPGTVVVHDEVSEESWQEGFADVADVDEDSMESKDEIVINFANEPQGSQSEWAIGATANHGPYSVDSIGQMNVSPVPAAYRNKKKGSGLRTAVGVILGGALALPIAGGLLTLVGQKPDWGFWPFDGQQDGDQPRAVAAPPRELSSFDQQPIPTGRSIELPPVEEEIAVPADAAEDALDQIMETPSDDTPQLNDSIGLPAENSQVADVAADEPDESNSKPPPERSKNVAVKIVPIEDIGVEQPSLATESTTASAASNETIAEDVPPESSDLNDAMLSAPSETTAADTPPENSDLNDATLSAPSKTTAADVPPESSDLNDATLSAPSKTTAGQAPPVDSDLNDATLEPLPPVESAELVAAIKQASDQLDAIIAFDGPTASRKSILANAYKQIAEVAAVEGASESKSVTQLLSKIKTSPALEEYRNVGPAWVNHAKRRTPGVLLIGRSESKGNGQMIVSESGKVVSISGGNSLPTGTVIALGRIVDSGPNPVIELVAADEL